MQLRRLHQGDNDLLARAVSAFGSWESVQPLILEDANAVVVVAEDGTELGGWAWGYRVPRPDGRYMFLLYDLEVTEAHRRKGVGRAMLQAMLELAAGLECFEMWLVTEADNHAAIGLYETAGGTRSDRGDVVYSWEL